MNVRIKMNMAALGLVVSPQLAHAQASCGESSYQAESMYQSTGGAVASGWNIWSNGYIATDHDFQGGQATITVVARGQFANGVAPQMVTTVGGTQISSIAVTSTDWVAYTFVADVSPGTQEVQVHFTNDYNQNGEDRNLYVDQVVVAECDSGWTDLTLLNGWQQAADSQTPQVGLVNGVVTFRGALDGTAATSATAFCLYPQAPGEVDYAEFRPEDAGLIGLRGALANQAHATLVITPIETPPEGPDPTKSYCMVIDQDWSAIEPGPDSRVLTSLEGVSFDQTIANSVTLDRAPGWEFSGAYPWRGSDTSHSPDGTSGVFARIVDGFVRFQGVLVPDDENVESDVLFTLPPEMIPAETAYVPVTLCPSGDSAPGHLVVLTNGDVAVGDAFDRSRCGVSLDGASYSISPSSAEPLALANDWSPFGSAPRVRLHNGVVRFEGGVVPGSAPTIAFLPPEMRPAVDLYVVSTAFYLAQAVTLKVRPDGGVELLTPGVVAIPGVFLDGVSFALESFECSGACTSANPLARYQNSGNFNATGEVWFVVSDTINGWQVSELHGRTISVNGVQLQPGEMPLPPAVNGSHYFHFSAGPATYTSWSFW